MDILRQLNEVEEALGFRYPASFVSTVGAFSSMLAEGAFEDTFLDARLILTLSEIEAARTGMPDSLIPFMGDIQSDWTDFYAFEIKGGGPEFEVAVWADHAVVMDWENFPQFLQWLNQRRKAAQNKSKAHGESS